MGWVSTQDSATFHAKYRGHFSQSWLIPQKIVELAGIVFILNDIILHKTAHKTPWKLKGKGRLVISNYQFVHEEIFCFDLAFFEYKKMFLYNLVKTCQRLKKHADNHLTVAEL